MVAAGLIPILGPDRYCSRKSRFDPGGTSTSKISSEVTRFHLDKPIAPQPVVVEVSNTAEGSNNQVGDYGEIVAAELTALGFSRAEADDAKLVALVNVRQYTQEKLPQRSPVSIGIGGSLMAAKTC